MFRETLEATRPLRDPRMGGRPPYDALHMFKVLVLRELFTLSDKQVEHDRLFTKRLYLQFSGIIRRLSFKSHANPGPML